MIDGPEESPKRKCTIEAKCLLNRWECESDLESQEIVDAVNEAIEEYYELGDYEEEEFIEFDPDLNEE